QSLTSWLELSKHLIPQIAVFEHDLPQQPNRRCAVAEHLVVELLQSEGVSLLLAIVFAEFENLELSERVVKILRIKCSAHGLLTGGLLLVITVVLKEFGSVLHIHALAMHFDGYAKSAKPQQRLIGLRQAVLGCLDLVTTGIC